MVELRAEFSCEWLGIKRSAGGTREARTYWQDEDCTICAAPEIVDGSIHGKAARKFSHSSLKN
jgi:hypothetical protein